MSAQPAGKGGRYLAIAACVVVVATLGAAITVMGTPAQQRLARLDEGRIDDLQAVVAAVRRHASTRGALPTDLQAISAGPRWPPKDRVTGAAYGYAVKSPTTFELCATFDTDSQLVRLGDARWRDDAAAWSHPAGPHCFEFPLKKAD